jgi:hypothetical protein
MTTRDARAEAIERYINMPYRDQYVSGFEAGAIWSDSRYRPLIEAARAYRDARDAFIRDGVAVTYIQFTQAEEALFEAATTLGDQ